MKINRLMEQMRRQSRRGDLRHHRLEDELAEMKANTGRIIDLERELVAVREALAAHTADLKKHTGK